MKASIKFRNIGKHFNAVMVTLNEGAIVFVATDDEIEKSKETEGYIPKPVTCDIDYSIGIIDGETVKPLESYDLTVSEKFDLLIDVGISKLALISEQD